jgi:hypothetical protein
MILITIVLGSAFKRWYDLLQIQKPVKDRYGDLVLEVVEE